MKCRSCGYVSFDGTSCKRCGADLAAGAGAPAPGARAPSDPGGDADLAAELASLRLDPETEPAAHAAGPEETGSPASLREEEEDAFIEGVEVDDASDWSDGSDPSAEDGAGDPLFHLDDDVIPPPLSGSGRESFGATARDAGWAPPGRLRPDDQPAGGPAPIIDRDDEVPERFWAPEGAPLGRRIAALVVDQAVLLALLGLFFAAALLALRLGGFDADHLGSPAGLRGVLLPFGLLGLLLGAAYFTFFHGWSGRTPGKLLAGVEVRTLRGEGPSYGRALLRTLGGLVSFAAVGAGLVWALFEPRRRGWADLVSGTVVGSRRAP